MRERAGGGELLADEIARGDVGDAEESGEAAGVGALADAGAAEEHPLHVPVLGILAASQIRVCGEGEQRRRGGRGGRCGLGRGS